MNSRLSCIYYHFINTALICFIYVRKKHNNANNINGLEEHDLFLPIQRMTIVQEAIFTVVQMRCILWAPYVVQHLYTSYISLLLLRDKNSSCFIVPMTNRNNKPVQVTAW